LNIKKCLITIVSAILMTGVMHAQEASTDLSAEQLAQKKAELDAREKALDRREKILAEKEEAGANSALRSREKAGAKAKQQEAKAQSKEEQAKAAAAEKKTARTILETSRRRVSRTIRHARLHPRNAATRTAHSAAAIRFTTLSQCRLANRRHSRHSDHR